jgi:Fe-S-cluster containining protein
MSQACLTCGACCATFRVSFYWAETDAHPQGSVPEHLTTAISPHYVAMQGVSQPQPRCVALAGNIGDQVSCNIYAQRSSTYRSFDAGDERCHQARMTHGLTPLPAIGQWQEACDGPVIQVAANSEWRIEMVMIDEPVLIA